MRRTRDVSRVVSAIEVTDWTQDDFTGPGAELAPRWHALEDESMEVLRQLREVEQRRRECEEAVG